VVYGIHVIVPFVGGGSREPYAAGALGTSCVSDPVTGPPVCVVEAIDACGTLRPMKLGDIATFKSVRPRPAMQFAAAVVCVTCLSSAVAFAPKSAAAPGALSAVHFACSGPNSSKVPCHFSTPSGNIRCLWTPHPNNVACELLASGRAYRLRPTGRAKAIRLRLARRGQTLPRNQQIVFPQSLSCHDTKTTMTCNQDFGTGEFKLAPAHIGRL
jgi:hypothetical protein